MLHLRKSINTKKYWGSLLQSGKWGKGQEYLYTSIAKLFSKKKITILDIGCANAFGTMALKNKLKNATIDACDFSKEAISNAKKKFGMNIDFFVHDVAKDKLKNKYDYILMIETLEHLDNPDKIVKKYLKCCKNMIVIVPYNETESDEHVYSFDEDSFSNFKEFLKYAIFTIPGTDLEMIIYIFESNNV